MAVFGVLFIIITGMVSNTSHDSIEKVNDQLFLMNCNQPIYNGLASGFVFEGFILKYNVTYNLGNDTGTFFWCSLDLLSDPHYNVQVIQVPYGHTSFGFIADGWLRYIADWLTNGFERGTALAVLISYYLTPANFDIGGYTLADIGGLGAMFVIGIYVISYASIFALIYKIIDPFSG